MTCPDIFECINECPAENLSCQELCVDSAPIDEQVRFNDLVACLNETGYWECPAGDTNCEAAKLEECGSYTMACFNWDKTCFEIYLCLIDCPEGSEECPSDCITSGTEAAQGTWKTFADCLEDKGYFACGETDTVCLEDSWAACSSSFKKCAHGEDKCEDMVYCMNECPETDEECLMLCYLNGSVNAQKSYDAILTCIEGECPDPVTTECREAALDVIREPAYNKCMGID